MNSAEPVELSPLVWRRSGDLSHRTLAGITVVRRLWHKDQIVLRSISSLVWVGLQSPTTSSVLAEDLRSVDVEISDDEMASELDRLAAFGLIVADG